MPPGASRFCRVDGASREPLPGSTDVAGSPRTSRLQSQAPLLGSSSPISAASPGGSQWLESNQLFMSQTLRPRQGVSTSHTLKDGAAHVAFERMKTLGPCNV